MNSYKYQDAPWWSHITPNLRIIHIHLHILTIKYHWHGKIHVYTYTILKSFYDKVVYLYNCILNNIVPPPSITKHESKNTYEPIIMTHALAYLWSLEEFS